MTALPRAAAAVLTVLVAAAVALVAPAPASAHDVLVGASPSPGSTVAAAPGAVVLTFDQPALAIGTRLVVTGPDGRTVSSGAVRCVDDTVAQDLAGALPAGQYTVLWRVTSADGHPVSSRFSFTAGGPGRGAAATGVADSTPPQPAGSDRGVFLAGGAVVALLVGMVVLARLRRRPAVDAT